MIRSILMVVLPAVVFSAWAEGPVHEFALDNRLKVIVKEDHRAPIVVTQVWYKVGSSYEPAGTTGVSHVLEHMMFKGTPNHPPGQFSRIIAANGGRENAFTGRDYTAYFQTLSRDRLEIAFELEADRMRHLTLPEEEFRKEIEVVKEERRMRTEDKPTSLTYEQLLAVAYRNLPYSHPIIGWMSDLENMSVDDLRRWYQLWYAPNNATLVVVGDVDPAAVLKLAEKYFGPLKPENIPAQKPRIEPPQRGETRVSVRAPAREPYLIMGYKTPVVGHADQEWEPYALDILTSILDGGSSARLTRRLVRGEEIAVSAGASYSAFARLPGMLLMDGAPAPGHDIEEVERALREEADRLKKEPVSAEELSRVRAQVVAGKVYELDSVFYQAMQIGTLETIGLDWRLIDEYAERIKKVTPQQISQVAQKYLTEDNLTVAVLDPLPLDGKKPLASRGGHDGTH
ncbi:MAG: insulinase family protein [Gammaproteobacteria bacterium]|nr:insulinase family protein [Gammaproteobacteria bacterium]